jgi:pimeloyl-ACP methyl ester carboxylesterase
MRSRPNLVLTLLLPFAAGSATTAAQATEPLEVPGFHPAEHVVPDPGTRGPRPVVVILHGNFDRPEWNCEAWSSIVAGRAFILCPRGVPRRDSPGMDRWEYGGRPSILREVAAGRAALATRYPGRVDPGPDVWVGFSLGAIHLSPLARGAPERYPRIVLVEGGLDGWDRRSIARFVAGGGRKIGFACGREGCRRRAEGLSTMLDGAGGGGRVAFAPIGHNFHGPILAPTKRVFDWLVEDDARFSPGAGSGPPR